MTDRITPQKYNDFLEMLSEIGNAAKCCEALGMSRGPVYARRTKNKTFRKKWKIAKKLSIARLEDEAWRRAFEGIKKPVFYKGEQIENPDGTPYFERVYSDTLMMHRLNAERPDKYHYRQSVEHSGNIVTEVHVNFIKAEVEKDETGS